MREKRDVNDIAFLHHLALVLIDKRSDGPWNIQMTSDRPIADGQGDRANNELT